MSLLYTGRIDKLEIGTAAAANTDIDNVVLMNWERNHDVRPRLYANLKYPRTYQQPHSWVLGSFSCLSDNHNAVYATDVQAAAGNQFAMYPDADSNVIDFFQVTYQDEDGNQRVTRFFHAMIYRHNKELLNYDDSVWVYHFIAGYAVDDEVTPLELNLISVSGAATSPIYVHDRITCTVNTSCSFGSSKQLKGAVVNADGNLCVISQADNSLFVMDGISCTVLTSCSCPGSGIPWGLAVDGSGNLIIGEQANQSFYFMDGVTCSVLTSCSTPAASPTGIVVDGDGNLISQDSASGSIYFHDGLSCTVLTSCSTPGTGPTGLTIDEGGNLVSADNNTDSFYMHSGLTCTVLTSCSSPDAGPSGLAVTET